jgi:hypothetical protein
LQAFWSNETTKETGHERIVREREIVMKGEPYERERIRERDR